MKKLILLLFIPLVSFGQSFDDALNFLKINEPDWACEAFAVGTFKKRLEISTDENNSKLILSQYITSSLSDNYYSISEIHLSKIIRIEAQQSDKGCAGIKIITDEYGISSKAISVNGKVLIDYKKMEQDFFPRFGWFNEQIRIKNDEYFNERSKRIIKAIEFMALENGAELKQSYF